MGRRRPVADEVVRLVNERHGCSFRLRGRCAGGEGAGAWNLDGPFVLKWYPDARAEQRFRRAATATAALRARGYPAPAYELVGAWDDGAYAVMQRLDGEPMPHIVTDATPLLELIELQADLPVLPDDDWPAAARDPVLRGGHGFCLLDTMRAYSPATASLLDAAQAIASRAYAAPARDVVHLDFSPGNVLHRHGAVTGVVDWEAVHRGDRAFDVTTLAIYADDAAVRVRLLRSALALSGAVPLYLAHLAHRQVEWSVRHHTADVVELYIRRFYELVGSLDR